MAVQGTANYVYFPDQSLGVGASGTVYLGRHKRQGYLCACKVFRGDGSQRDEIAKQREFEVMSKLSHDNIVKFLAIEKESHGFAKILIMEYCSGGSVYKMLEDPSNIYGFEEEEFLIFLKHVTSALKYLSKERIVHRDIKPGNILRCVKDDLGSVYKITDFGAARRLSPDDEGFMSLYGTEEYLHPEVYQRALLGGRRFAPLSASIDLWSLGVTIYHVATGRLPFQSYGGRQNKEDMYRIISQKKSGDISGVQSTKDGGIEWSHELPHTCQLSRGLRRKLEIILSRLLESDERRQWNFETFFRESVKLTTHRPLHFFCLHSASLEVFYYTTCPMTMIQMQGELVQLVDVPVERQSLLHASHPVPSFLPTRANSRSESYDLKESDNEQDVTESLCCHSYRYTLPRSPLFVYPKSFSERSWRPFIGDLPKQPDLAVTGNLSDDVTLARTATGFVIYIRNCAKKLRHSQQLMIDSVKLLVDELLSDVRALRSSAQTAEMLCSSKLTRRAGDDSSSKDESVIRNVLSATDVRTDVFTKFFDECRTKLCLPEHRCLKRLKKSVMELSQIYSDFREHKKKELTYNEQQIHKFDRSRISVWMSRAVDHYQKHCVRNTEDMLQIVQRWYSTFYLPKIDDLENCKQSLNGVVKRMSSTPPSSTVGDVIRPIGRAQPTPVLSDDSVLLCSEQSRPMLQLYQQRHQWTAGRPPVDGFLEYTKSVNFDLSSSALPLELQTNGATSSDYASQILEDVIQEVPAHRLFDNEIEELISGLTRSAELIKTNMADIEQNSASMQRLLENSS